MVKVDFKGTVEEYAGKKLDKPISYSGQADKYENVAEAKASEDWLNDNDILKVVNRNKLTAAKAAEYQKAVADLKTAYENSPEYKVAQLVKSLVAMGKTQAEAEAIAASL